RVPFHTTAVAHAVALKFLDDVAAFSEKAPRFLSAREEERAKPELVAQAPRADQIPIGDQTPEREREEEGERPAETGDPSDQRRLSAQKSGNATMLVRTALPRSPSPSWRPTRAMSRPSTLSPI